MRKNPPIIYALTVAAAMAAIALFALGIVDQVRGPALIEQVIERPPG